MLNKRVSFLLRCLHLGVVDNIDRALIPVLEYLGGLCKTASLTVFVPEVGDVLPRALEVRGSKLVCVCEVHRIPYHSCFHSRTVSLTHVLK